MASAAQNSNDWHCCGVFLITFYTTVATIREGLCTLMFFGGALQIDRNEWWIRVILVGSPKSADKKWLEYL